MDCKKQNGTRRLKRRISLPKASLTNYLKGTRWALSHQSADSAQRLADWGIGKYFDLVIASADEGVEKPNTEIFKIALERANCLPENAVMVGDRIDNDILPAKKLGIKTVWLKQGFAKYQPESDVPDYTIQTLETISKVM